jgi:hypothetical protein
MNNPDPIYTPGRITFGHQAESNWHKAEALRLDEENLTLHRQINALKACLEDCYAKDPATAQKRLELLKEEDGW